MLQRAYRSWRGLLRCPLLSSNLKHCFSLLFVVALCLPGASAAAADATPPSPLSSGAFGAISGAVMPCVASAGSGDAASLPAPVIDTAPLPPQEYHPTGFVVPPMDLSYLTGEGLSGRLSATASMSETFDWRDRDGTNYVTPVRDQASCGACYAFAALGNIESKTLIDGVTPAPDYSENHAKDCTWLAANEPGLGGCTGGNYLMLADLFSKFGTVNETDDPYTPLDGTCQSPAGPYQTTLLGWQMLSGPTMVPTMTIKQALVDNGPLYSAIYAGDPQDPVWDGVFQSYDGSFVLNYTGTVATTNHTVLIVGWDDTATYGDGQGAWIAKNSWGSGWGDGGYFRIAYGSAGIGTYVSYMTQWQPYDADGELLAYDEAGWTGYLGYVGSHTIWGLNVFTVTQQAGAMRVEFWAPDAMMDVDVYLYSGFDGGALGAVLWQSLDHTYPTAGYYSIPVDPPLSLAPDVPVTAVVHFTAQSTEKPLPVDGYGEVSGNSYLSYAGESWELSPLDIGIRLRISTAPTDLVLTKELLGDEFAPGDPITFTLTLENQGTGLAQGTVLTDIMPAEVLSTTVAGTVLITETGGQDYVWQVAPLSAGESAVITITGQVAGRLGEDGSFVNTARVYDPADSDLTNNTSLVFVNPRRTYLPLVLRN